MGLSIEPLAVTPSTDTDALYVPHVELGDQRILNPAVFIHRLPKGAETQHIVSYCQGGKRPKFASPANEQPFIGIGAVAAIEKQQKPNRGIAFNALGRRFPRC